MTADLEHAIRRAPHDPAPRLAYASWLEAQGFAERAAYVRALADLTAQLDRGASREPLAEISRRLSSLVRAIDPDFADLAALGAERWGGALAFSPVRLEVRPEPVRIEIRRWKFEPQLRPRILVVGDFLGRADPRPVEDRHPLSVTRETFARRLEEAKLCFTIDALTTITIRRLADFDADASQHEPLRAAERAWRSLWLLLQHAPADVHVDFVNGSKGDLANDFEDAPEATKSGLYRLANQYNHHGMRPYALLVLDHLIDPASAADRRLLGHLGDVARRSLLPIVAAAPSSQRSPEHAAFAAFRADPRSGYVALCAPAFELRRSEHGALHGAASFLVACLAAQGLSRNLCASPLLGSVPDVALAETIDAERAREHGVLAFAPGPAGAALRVDTTCLRADTAHRSLSAALLLTRAGHLALDVEHRSALCWKEHDAERIAADFDARLAAGFAPIEGVRVTVSEIERVPDWGLWVTLTVTAPSPTSPRGTTLRDRFLFRTLY